MSPHDDLVTADQPAWCLADPNRVYLVYIPEGESLQLDLSAAAGSFNAQSFDPPMGIAAQGVAAEGGANREFRAPSPGDWVLLVER